ncbi:MAG TPA: L,D-transpeptidase, partial [Acidimicrobiales bacterium]
QAIYALQKAASIGRDGVVGPVTRAAIKRGVRAKPRKISGYAVQINLSSDLLMIVKNGKLVWAFNTSTGGGYTYVDQGIRAVALTPRGVFRVFRQVNGLDTSSLGQLWRPKYFYSGFAIHGDSFVPSNPVSHGCVRVSNEAINWIWAHNLIPLGTKVWVYS